MEAYESYGGTAEIYVGFRDTRGVKEVLKAHFQQS